MKRDKEKNMKKERRSEIFVSDDEIRVGMRKKSRLMSEGGMKWRCDESNASLVYKQASDWNVHFFFEKSGQRQDKEGMRWEMRGGSKTDRQTSMSVWLWI